MLDRLFSAAQEVRNELVNLTNQLHEANKKLNNIETMIAKMIVDVGESSTVKLPDADASISDKIFHPTKNIFNELIKSNQLNKLLVSYDNDAFRLPSIVVAGWPAGSYCDKYTRDAQLLIKIDDGFICINGFPKINGIRLFLNSFNIHDKVIYDAYFDDSNIAFKTLNMVDQLMVLESIQNRLTEMNLVS